jgi:hypothetical protein
MGNTVEIDYKPVYNLSGYPSEISFLIRVTFLIAHKDFFFRFSIQIANPKKKLKGHQQLLLPQLLIGRMRDMHLLH